MISVVSLLSESSCLVFSLALRTGSGPDPLVLCVMSRVVNAPQASEHEACTETIPNDKS